MHAQLSARSHSVAAAATWAGCTPTLCRDSPVGGGCLQGAGIFRNGMNGDVTNIFFEGNDAALNGGGLYMVRAYLCPVSRLRPCHSYHAL